MHPTKDSLESITFEVPPEKYLTWLQDHIQGKPK